MSYSFQVHKVIKVEKIEGQKKDSRVVLDVKTVAGTDFVGLSWMNRNLTPMFSKKARGASKCGGGWPASVISFIKAARNLAVDKHIVEHIKKNDPMAEVVTLDHMSPRDRVNAFHDANVPAVLGVQQQAFVTDHGDHIEAQTINILSSPTRHKKLYLQMTSDNIKWLSMLFNRRTNPEDAIESDDDSDDEDARVESIKPLMPPGVIVVKGPKTGPTGHAWILRLQGAKRKQIQINYTVQDTEDIIKNKINAGLNLLYVRAGIAIEDS